LINIQKARSDHFEEVYELLKSLGEKNITKNDWKIYLSTPLKVAKDTVDIF